MNNTFMEGDKVVVNKLAFGARLPITPLSIHFGKTKKYIDWITLPYTRLWGYTSIKRNDIITFNLPSEIQYPIDEKKEMLKRCVALPGDVIEIKNSDVYINSALQNENFAIKKYNVVDNKSQNTYQNNEIYLSSFQIDSLVNKNSHLIFKKTFIQKQNYSPNIFPHHGNFKWNLDFFGALYVPKKGQAIPLNNKTLVLYKTLIEKYENCSVAIVGNNYFVDGTKTKTYTFKMNYYFVLGDNRYNSIDSRYWGLLPENHIVGIVL